MINNFTLFKDLCYVNGEWISAEKTIEVINPFDREVIGSIPSLSSEQTLNAIDAAYIAFDAWKKRPAQERSAILLKWKGLILSHKQNLATILVTEQGKTFVQALGEIEYATSYIDFYTQQILALKDEIIEEPQPGKAGKVRKEPVGVVGIITPWNFPAAMMIRKIAPALACGCTCVIKPDEKTPFTALALMYLAEEAGIPKGVLNCITGEAIEIGRLLCSSKKIQKISFTGSSKVGKLIMQLSSTTLKRLSLELGGNAPFIVFEDANLHAAVDGLITAKFRNAGQTCVCPNRVLVHQSIEDKFIHTLIDRMQSLTLGSGFQEVDYGPLIDDLAARKIQGLVDTSVELGAELLMGGTTTGALNNFYEPTLIKGLTPTMPLWQCEVFGPVITIATFKQDEEAVIMANDTRAGLAAYIYTNDDDKIESLTQEIDVGMIGINTGSISSAKIPFGGIKESGFGREGSKYGLEDYLSIKYLCTNQ